MAMSWWIFPTRCTWLGTSSQVASRRTAISWRHSLDCAVRRDSCQHERLPLTNSDLSTVVTSPPGGTSKRSVYGVMLTNCRRAVVSPTEYLSAGRSFSRYPCWWSWRSRWGNNGGLDYQRAGIAKRSFEFVLNRQETFYHPKICQ